MYVLCGHKTDIELEAVEAEKSFFLDDGKNNIELK